MGTHYVQASLRDLSYRSFIDRRTAHFGYTSSLEAQLMRLWRIFRFYFSANSVTVLAFISFLGFLPAAHGQTENKGPTTVPGQVTLQINSNLVVVRVVVRDAKGNPVEGLKKEDFEVFDRGQEQSITQFEEHVAEPAAAAPAVASVPRQAGQAPPPALPERFFALYFDDLHGSEASLIQARAAADSYLSTHIQPEDRVAIFRSEGMLSDFTADTNQIHDALLKLHIGTRSIGTAGCPPLSDYQADRIVREPWNQSNDAWETAMDAYSVCDRSPGTLEDKIREIKAEAQRVLDYSRVVALNVLSGLDQVVKVMAQVPGQRTLILVSPGFLADLEQEQLNQIIDDALRSQVVVSSLNPKGLVTMVDLSQIDMGPANGSRYTMESTRESLSAGVLEEIAQGTGGEYIKHSNDLKAGFGRLAGSLSYYTIAFAPRDVKLDGQFHPIKVQLSSKRKGVSLQARQGYFASPNQLQPAAPAAAPQAKEGSETIDPATHEQIREALNANSDTSLLAVTLDTSFAAGHGGMSELSLLLHLDGKNLPLRKDGLKSVNTVIFVFGVFDAKGNLLTGQQKVDKVTVPDGKLADFLKSGVDDRMTIELKPGTYKIRLVAIEAMEHRMTSFSRDVNVP